MGLGRHAPSGTKSRALLWATLGTTAYVSAGSIYATGGRGIFTWMAITSALVFAARAARSGEEPMRVRLRWASAIVLATLPAASQSLWIDLAGSLAAAVASLVAVVAILRIESPPSLVSLRPARPRTLAVPLALVWALACAVGVFAAVGSRFSAEDAAVALVVAGFFSAFLVIGSALAVARVRRLELGVPERAYAIAAAGASAVLFPAAMGLLRIASAIHLVHVAVVVGSFAAVHLASMDALRVAVWLRRLIVLVLVGGAAAMSGVWLVSERPFWGAGVTLVTSAICLLLGARAQLFEASLRPEKGRWIDAAEKAAAALTQDEPDEAIRRALLHLREPFGQKEASAELWTLEPLRVATVDRAGYFHDREAVLPPLLVDLAMGEPERTLRVEVLRGLQVRRPDLRGVLHWFEDRDVFSLTAIVREGAAEGLLVIPEGQRSQPLTLEEARSFHHLADGLAWTCYWRTTRAGVLEREQALRLVVQEHEEKIERLLHELGRERGRHAQATSQLARAALVGTYSPRARLAYESIEARVQMGAPIVVAHSAGVDPITYLARAHLSGPRRLEPFVVVDGSLAAEQDSARWSDPSTSPIALALGGLLVLFDGLILPESVQEMLARWLAERRTPWGGDVARDPQVAITTSWPPSEWRRAIHPSLFARFEDAFGAVVSLPRLSERSEDLRALLTDRLAREGLRVKGVPVGIEPAAFARLIEYDFPGEDHELIAIALRLVSHCSGNVVRAADVDALHLELSAGRRLRSPRDLVVQ